jgi:hypothetical protein
MGTDGRSASPVSTLAFGYTVAFAFAFAFAIAFTGTVGVSASIDDSWGRCGTVSTCRLGVAAPGSGRCHYSTSHSE